MLKHYLTSLNNMQVDSEESPKDVPMEDVQPTLDTEAAPPDEPPEVVDSLQNGSLSERKPDLTQEQGGSVAQTPVPAASPAAAASTSVSPEPKKPSDNPHYRTTYIMSGHTRSISSLKFSPDGKLLASCGMHVRPPLYATELNKRVWKESRG